MFVWKSAKTNVDQFKLQKEAFGWGTKGSIQGSSSRIKGKKGEKQVQKNMIHDLESKNVA